MGFPKALEAAVMGIIVFIGIGSNVGQPIEQCREAIRRIADVKDTKLLRASSFFRTEPVGPPDQDWFINAVVEIRTLLPPRELLEALKGIERAMGRTEGARWGPRIIDLDILFYGQEIVKEAGMVIPHPELHKRRFVLVPLSEMASYLIHPVFGISVDGLLKRLEDRSRVESYDPGRAE